MYSEKLIAEENCYEKKFRRENFSDCSLVPLKDAMPPYFVEKNFANSHKKP